jgi:Flp pilus assembly pilin Flp
MRTHTFSRRSSCVQNTRWCGPTGQEASKVKGGELMLKLFAFAQVAADSLRRREEGQTMAEYGVVLAVITLAVIAAITLLAGNVSNAINSVANLLP